MLWILKIYISYILFFSGELFFSSFYKKDILNFRAICYYTTLTNISTNYLVMCKVYTDVGGIKTLYYVCLHVPVCTIIHSLKLVDYKARGLSPHTCTGGQPMV